MKVAALWADLCSSLLAKTYGASTLWSTLEEFAYISGPHNWHRFRLPYTHVEIGRSVPETATSRVEVETHSM